MISEFRKSGKNGRCRLRSASEVEDIGENRHLGCIGYVKLWSSPESKALVKGDCLHHEGQRMEEHAGCSKIPRPVEALRHQRLSDAATSPVGRYRENSKRCPTRGETVPVLGAVRIEGDGADQASFTLGDDDVGVVRGENFPRIVPEFRYELGCYEGPVLFVRAHHDPGDLIEFARSSIAYG